MTGTPAAPALRWFLVVVCAAGLTVSVPTQGWVSLVSLLPAVMYAAIGVIVTRRQPANPIGWVFLGVGAVSGLIGAANALMSWAVSSGRPDAWYALTAALVSNFLWAVVLSLAFVMTLLLFPHGLPSPRWRAVLWLTVGATVGIVIAGSLSPTLTVGSEGPTFPNPLHPAPWGPVADTVWTALLALLSLCALLALLSSILRFARSAGVERAQMRWLAFSGVAMLVFMLIPAINGSDALFALVFSMFPLACGLAILRYRLYDIDRIISRTTSYAIVTGLLLATYGVIVATATRWLDTNSPLVVAAATLAAAALARPALRRVQGIVDRRFDRAHFDSIRTVDGFGSRLRHEVDAGVVTADLLSVVHGTLAPASVTLWLRGER